MYGTEVDRGRRVDVTCHHGGSDAKPDRPRTGSTLEVARSESRPRPVIPPSVGSGPTKGADVDLLIGDRDRRPGPPRPPSVGLTTNEEGRCP